MWDPIIFACEASPIISEQTRHLAPFDGGMLASQSGQIYLYLPEGLISPQHTHLRGAKKSNTESKASFKSSFNGAIHSKGRGRQV